MAVLFNDPEKIVFESDMDIVEYVSGGILIPSSKQFKAVMKAVSTGPVLEPLEEEPSEGKGKPELKATPVINIAFEAVPDPVLLEKYMKEVYKNRKKDRNRHIVIGAIAAALAMRLGMSLGKHSAEKDFKSNGYHSLSNHSDYFDADVPEID